MLTLRFATQDDRKELERVCFDEWAQDWGFVHYWESIYNKNIDIMLDHLPKMARGEELSEGHVPCTLMFAFDSKGKIIGRTSIRHVLNDHLLHEGGHIGYGVMPESRRKGYATEILKLSLDYCKNNLDLNRVLVTCDDDNIGSWKTIENNGGLLENKVTRTESEKICRRYWIDIC